jgi:hypothetical protein
MRVTFELEDRQLKAMLAVAHCIVDELETMNAQLARLAGDTIAPAAIAELTERLKMSATALRSVVDSTQPPQP